MTSKLDSLGPTWVDFTLVGCSRPAPKPRSSLVELIHYSIIYANVRLCTILIILFSVQHYLTAINAINVILLKYN